MIKSSALHTLAIVEINRLASELRTINNSITAPYPPMTGEEQKEHDVWMLPRIILTKNNHYS